MKKDAAKKDALPADVVPSLIRWTDRRQAEDPASLTFLPDRIAAMDVDSRPTDAERADLDRRLKEVLWPITDADWLVVIEQLDDGGRRVFASPRSAALERVWPAVFFDWQRGRDLARMAARSLLNQEAAKGEAKAKEPHAEEVLHAAVARRLDALLDVVGRAPDDTTTDRVADWLEAHELPKAAGHVRAQEWDAGRWCDPLFTARVLTLATWEEEAKDGLSRASVPGINLPVVGRIARARTAQGMLPLDGAGGWTIKDGSGRRIGEVVAIDGQLVKPELLQNVNLQKLLRFGLAMAHQQRVTGSLWDRPAARCDNVDKVVIDGGWARLAELLGLPPNKGAEVREAAEAFAALRLDSDAIGEGQLFGWFMGKEAHRGQRALLELTMMGPLGSHFVHRLDPRKHDRRIVPVPIPSLLPPMVGKRNEYGGLLMLQLLLMRTFRERGEDLTTAGGVLIEPRDWSRLLDEAGLRASILPAVQKAWRNGSDDAPAVLKDAPGGRLDLADAYASERAFIVAGVEEGKAKAKRAKAVRRRKGGK